MTGPRIGELFAGYGGLGMGVQAVYGGDVVWVSEFDKGPSKILEHRFPGVPNHGDITKIDWSTVEPVDILTGGSPCQDISGAGKRQGMTEGTRSNLWVAMREAIAQLKPALVVWENVGGAFSAGAASSVESCSGCMGDDPSKHLRALHRVLGDLASLGFDADWCALPASGVGAPHGRLRVFVTAWPAADAERGGCRGWAREARRSEVGGTAIHGHLEGPLLPTPAAYDADRGGPQHPDKRRAGGHSVSLQGALHGLTLLPTPAVNDMGDGKTVDAWDAWTERMKAEHDNGNGHGKSLAIELQRVESGWGPYTAAVERWEQVIGRPAPAPSEVVRVREWMMGLPDGWVTDVPGITARECKRALGNGVVPQQAAAALRVMASWEGVA